MDTFYPDPLTASSRSPSLWFRLAIPFVAFVALGSSALVLWFQYTAQRDSLQLFAAETRSNAEFVRTTRLPATARTAESLSRVLGMEVGFAKGVSWEIEAGVVQPGSKPKGASDRLGETIQKDKVEAIAWPIDDETRMWFVRKTASGTSTLWQPRTLAVLGGFWLLALALAWALSRGIVTPLRQLAARLPHIENDPEASLPGAERNDEIGQVARAYLSTRTQLAQERTRREQAERLALLGRMATGLAHEIHNPLSAIRMHAQLLESSSDAELASAAKESLPIMLTETMRIESLVSQWMFLVRPEPPKTAPLRVAEIIDKIIRVYELAARHAGVRVENSVDENLRVNGDARRLEQAVSNVVLNAIQAMPEGGELKIDAQRQNGRVRVRFADNGSGFSDTALARHSELFFSEREGGMGIGLSVSAEILRAHGGEVRAENHGLGAVVTFDLPHLSS